MAIYLEFRWPLSWREGGGGGGRALMALPLVEELFFAASLSRSFLTLVEIDRISLNIYFFYMLKIKENLKFSYYHPTLTIYGNG